MVHRKRNANPYNISDERGQIRTRSNQINSRCGHYEITTGAQIKTTARLGRANLFYRRGWEGLGGGGGRDTKHLFIDFVRISATYLCKCSTDIL